MIRNVILHLNNEQPLLADLFEAPSPGDVGLRCTNLRSMNGKRPVFIDDVASIFFFPYLHIRVTKYIDHIEILSPSGICDSSNSRRHVIPIYFC